VLQGEGGVIGFPPHSVEMLLWPTGRKGGGEVDDCGLLGGGNVPKKNIHICSSRREDFGRKLLSRRRGERDSRDAYDPSKRGRQVSSFMGHLSVLF